MIPPARPAAVVALFAAGAMAVPPAARGMTPRAAPAAHATRQAAQEAPRESLAGRVVHGVGGGGVAGSEVELHRVTTDDGGVIDSAVSAEDGSFRFALPDDESRPVFLVAARHDGVRYFGPALHAGLAMEEAYEVPVYDTSSVAEPPEDVRVGTRHVVVTSGPADAGLDVAEVIDVVGPDDRTLVPASPTAELWSTALPGDATGARALEGSGSEAALQFVGGRVLLRSMIAPAGARLAYTYAVEGRRLRLSVEHPVDHLQLVVAGVEAEVDGAVHAETSTRSGRLVHRYEGAGLEPGDVVEVRLVDPASGVDRWVWIWTAVGVGLLALAGLLWWTGERPRAA